jgi:hypothetical protein
MILGILTSHVSCLTRRPASSEVAMTPLEALEKAEVDPVTLAERFLNDAMTPYAGVELNGDASAAGERALFRRLDEFSERCRLDYVPVLRENLPVTSGRVPYSVDILARVKDQLPTDKSVLGSTSVSLLMVPIKYVERRDRGSDDPAYAAIRELHQAVDAFLKRVVERNPGCLKPSR